VFLIHPSIFKSIFEAHHGYDFPCLCQPLSTTPITTNMYYTTSQEFTHVNTNNLHLVIISYQLCRNPNLAKCGGEAQHLEKLGIWSPPGLPNWQFDSRPLKVGNRPLPEVRIGSAIRRWKELDEGYNFGSDLVAIRSRSREL